MTDDTRPSPDLPDTQPVEAPAPEPETDDEDDASDE